jgi:hypothetical protein
VIPNSHQQRWVRHHCHQQDGAKMTEATLFEDRLPVAKGNRPSKSMSTRQQQGRFPHIKRIEREGFRTRPGNRNQTEQTKGLPGPAEVHGNTQRTLPVRSPNVSAVIYSNAAPVFRRKRRYPGKPGEPLDACVRRHDKGLKTPSLNLGKTLSKNQCPEKHNT